MKAAVIQSFSRIGVFGVSAGPCAAFVGAFLVTDLSQSSPGLGILSQAQVQTLNPVVGAMIR